MCSQKSKSTKSELSPQFWLSNLWGIWAQEDQTPFVVADPEKLRQWWMQLSSGPARAWSCLEPVVNVEAGLLKAHLTPLPGYLWQLQQGCKATQGSRTPCMGFKFHQSLDDFDQMGNFDSELNYLDKETRLGESAFRVWILAREIGWIIRWETINSTLYFWLIAPPVIRSCFSRSEWRRSRPHSSIWLF